MYPARPCYIFEGKKGAGSQGLINSTRLSHKTHMGESLSDERGRQKEGTVVHNEWE